MQANVKVFHGFLIVPVSHLARCIRCAYLRRKYHKVRKSCPSTGREPLLPPCCFHQSEPQVGNRCSGPTDKKSHTIDHFHTNHAIHSTSMSISRMLFNVQSKQCLLPGICRLFWYPLRPGALQDTMLSLHRYEAHYQSVRNTPRPSILLRLLDWRRLYPMVCSWRSFRWHGRILLGCCFDSPLPACIHTPLGSRIWLRRMSRNVDHPIPCTSRELANQRFIKHYNYINIFTGKSQQVK